MNKFKDWYYKRGYLCCMDFDSYCVVLDAITKYEGYLYTPYSIMDKFIRLFIPKWYKENSYRIVTFKAKNRSDLQKIFNSVYSSIPEHVTLLNEAALEFMRLGLNA